MLGLPMGMDQIPGPPGASSRWREGLSGQLEDHHLLLLLLFLVVPTVELRRPPRLVSLTVDAFHKEKTSIGQYGFPPPPHRLVFDNWGKTDWALTPMPIKSEATHAPLPHR